MTDTAETAAGFLATLGIKLGMLIAGFGGGVVSVFFSQGLTRGQALFSILCSLLTATYLTPVIVIKLGITTQEVQCAVAFVVGLCTMSIVPAIKAAGARVAPAFLDKMAQPASGEEKK